MRFTQSQALDHVKALLQEVMEATVDVISASQRQVSFSTPEREPDLLLQSDSYLFLVQVKQSSSAASVLMAANQLRRYSSEIRKQSRRSIIVVPLLVVPYMGQVGQRICNEEGISWLDLSDNANIRAPRLRVFITGHKNRFAKRGRKATPFAPKASRLARQLLLSPQSNYTHLLQKLEVSATCRRLVGVIHRDELAVPGVRRVPVASMAAEETRRWAVSRPRRVRVCHGVSCSPESPVSGDLEDE